MNVLSRAVYDIADSGRCPHDRAAFTRDVTVASGLGPWYVWCLDCGASGPPADTPDAALAGAWPHQVDADAPIGLEQLAGSV